MRCSKCGQLLAEEAKYCPSCGTRVEEQKQTETVVSNDTDWYSNIREENNYSYDEKDSRGSSQPALPMKWYKFLIYVSLILSCVVNIFSGVQSLMGMQYGDGETADLIYSTYAALKPVDIVYGLAGIALGVFAFIVRSRLAHYRKDAPKLLMIFYAAGFGMNIVYVMVASLITGMNLMSVSIVSNLVVSAAMIAANKVYFDKRAHLFNT